MWVLSVAGSQSDAFKLDEMEGLGPLVSFLLSLYSLVKMVHTASPSCSLFSADIALFWLRNPGPWAGRAHWDKDTGKEVICRNQQSGVDACFRRMWSLCLWETLLRNRIQNCGYRTRGSGTYASLTSQQTYFCPQPRTVCDPVTASSRPFYSLLWGRNAGHEAISHQNYLPSLTHEGEAPPPVSNRNIKQQVSKLNFYLRWVSLGPLQMLYVPFLCCNTHKIYLPNINSVS